MKNKRQVSFRQTTGF